MALIRCKMCGGDMTLEAASAAATCEYCGSVQTVPMQDDDKKLMSKAETTAIHEQVVVSGSNKLAALLDRGNMALEDGDWEKADSFFEDVLNNDSKNAQAYLGRTLAQERCRTIDAFIQKRKDATERNYYVRAEMSPDDAHIQESVEKFSIRNFVSKEQIRQLYVFDLSYATQVMHRQKQQQEEQRYWQNHSTLSRAEKFATGELAEILQRKKTALLAVFADRVKQAEADEAARQQEVQARYAQHILAANGQAKLIYAAGAERREQQYQRWMQVAKTSEKTCDLEEADMQLHQLGDYKDSKALAQTCRDRVAEIRAKQDAELRAKRDAEVAQQEQEAKKRNKRYLIIATVALVVILGIIAFGVVYFTVIAPMQAYNDAAALKEEGKYLLAAEAFDKLGDYSDSKVQAQACRKAEAERLTPIREKYAPASQMISAGGKHTVGLKADGTVVAVGSNDDGQCNVKSWKDIVDITAGDAHTVGLKADGTVVAVGYMEDGRCGVENWENIVAIAAGSDHTVGLKADGTVVAVGRNHVGQCNVQGWTDIVAIAADCHHTVGLKADGTLVAVGWNTSGQRNVQDWENILVVAAGDYHTVGLKAHGTVVAVGSNSYGQCKVKSWENIVAVAAGSNHTVGLKADGTVVAVGYNDEGQCDVESWKNIVAIAAGDYHTVGLKADGTLVAVGWNTDGRCDVGSWKLFDSIEDLQ